MTTINPKLVSSASIELVSSSARVTSAKSQPKLLYVQRPGPIDRPQRHLGPVTRLPVILHSLNLCVEFQHFTVLCLNYIVLKRWLQQAENEQCRKKWSLLYSQSFKIESRVQDICTMVMNVCEFLGSWSVKELSLATTPPPCTCCFT